MKAMLKALVGPRLLGRFDYHFKPSLRESWGGPLNGQGFRRQMYEQLIKTFEFRGIVETGTYLGTTTSLFAESGLEVYTVESNPRYFAYSARRLRGQGKIHLHFGDSIAFLESLARHPSVGQARLFFYLDAHWYDHLPLLDELQIILTNWPDSVVLIDDFCVPDSTYGYDDYGSGNALTLEYLAPLHDRGIAAFFPAVPAEQETGLRRGSVVIAREGSTADVLRGLSTLRPGGHV